ncbi:hypothetical protein [Cellulomonas sp. KRMCY2]|uniref:hypothetical protein n=1 Tax=Cellulomonas sp. KRMCY2 TaxID=1304865 RepID=UPI00045E8973|nr:hypothetical protein [Cellulomonas sp. KRMCY2]
MADPRTTGPDGPHTTPDPVRDVFRRALRDMLVLVGLVAVLGTGIGALVGGLPGVWGAVIGVAIVLVFSGTTVLAMVRTAGSSITVASGVLVGTWILKMVVVLVVVAVLRDQEFYHRGVLVAVVAVAVLGSAFVDFRAASSGRVPYTEPRA